MNDRIHSVVIPPTIQDVLMARIDRLDEESRNVVKVASVIGRSFFYRILADVARSIDGLDDKLAHLKEIQLIRERVRMEELEYLFKHALAQEAAYEATLLLQRKQLHLKVAEAIERIFRDRLHEFYGILALHYSKADSFEKAEEYMVKAGEEALRSSASSEALDYYKQALTIYLDKYGDDADPEKLAFFEKNIALAYFNKGQYEDAARNFDKVFQRWGRRQPKSLVGRIAKLAFDWPVLFLRLLLPSMGRKRYPDQRVNEFFDLAFKKDIALVHADPMKEFFEQIGEARESMRWDLSKMDIGAVFHLGTSTLFAYTGFFRMGSMHLKYAKGLVDGRKTLDRVADNWFTFFHQYATGQWNAMAHCDTASCDDGLKEGLYWYVACHQVFWGFTTVSQGKFNEADASSQYLRNIWEQYEYALARVYADHVSDIILIVSRKASAKQMEKNALVQFALDCGLPNQALLALGMNAVASVLEGDEDAARQALKQAHGIIETRGVWPPAFVAWPFLGQFLLDLHLLESAIGGDSRNLVSQYSEAALKSGKRAVRVSKSLAQQRTWAYMLMGQYYWQIGKQRKALKWFDKSIKEGERLGARPDLSRTYMEVGKRLLERNSKYSELNGIRAKEYLDKAEALFREMDLEWDLEQLDRVRTERGV